jgi:hypothetical protein
MKQYGIKKNQEDLLIYLLEVVNLNILMIKIKRNFIKF